jgi:lipoprotein-anchoring transpeptidase ErfK/SrfK
MFAPPMWRRRRTLLLAWSVVAFAAGLPAATARADDASCSDLPGAASVGAPDRVTAWRAEIEARTAVYDRLPTSRARPSHRFTLRDPPWLLVLARPRAADDHCWLRVRLPWRPNSAAGWVDAGKVSLEQTPWRIDVSTARRTLTLYKHGARMGAVRVVVGKPSTPTPAGLFAVTWAIRWHPGSFLGSWVLELTAHSNVLQRFDGGDGTVGIHGRGGASLLDPLGSARSHGCIRLANQAIDWLVRTIGVHRLPGTPVRVR